MTDRSVNGHSDGNVFQLPTEAINADPTRMYDRIEPPLPPAKGKVQQVMRKCINQPKAEVENTPPPVNKRQTVSADITRQRMIREKCYTIREIAITILAVFASGSMILFMVWLQFLLWTWQNSQ